MTSTECCKTCCNSDIANVRHSQRSSIFNHLQVKYLLGYNVPRANQLHKMLYSLIKESGQLRWPELVMGLSWIALLLTIKFIAVRQK